MTNAIGQTAPKDRFDLAAVRAEVEQAARVEYEEQLVAMAEQVRAPASCLYHTMYGRSCCDLY